MENKLKRSKRKTVEIDDVIQLSEIPIPIQITDTDIRALCPYCGGCRALVSKPDDPADIARCYIELVQKAAPHFEEHYKKCSEPKVNLVLKLVKIVYSFEGIQDTFDELDIQLTAEAISGEDASIQML